VSVKLLVNVVIVFKRYSSTCTYCLMRGRCFILQTYYLYITITAFTVHAKVNYIFCL